MKTSSVIPDLHVWRETERERHGAANLCLKIKGWNYSRIFTMFEKMQLNPRSREVERRQCGPEAPAFMEPEGSLPSAQQPANGNYSESDQYNALPLKLLL
jgi:hypothetical protein